MKNIGKLQEGYSADFMLLEEDLETLPEEELHKILPSEVYIRGKKVRF